MVPPERARAMVAALKKAGGNPLYTEFPKLKHNLSSGPAQTPGTDALDLLAEA